MTRIRGYLTIPKQLYDRSETAIERLTHLGVNVFGFNSFRRGKQKENSGFKGFFINGKLNDNFSDSDVMKLFYGTKNISNIIKNYGSKTLSFDISSGSEVWPMKINEVPSSYYSKRFTFLGCCEKQKLINTFNSYADYEKVGFRIVEPCVIALEEFENSDLINKIAKLLKDNYMHWEDTKID